VPITDDAKEHVSLFAAEAGSRVREVDSPACGVFGRFLDIRADADEMHWPALGDDRVIGRSSTRSFSKVMRARTDSSRLPVRGQVKWVKP